MAEQEVLVVEDDRLNLELVVDLLEANGFSVITATDAEQGLRLARERLPSIILMDIGLPGMDGVEAARVLKGDPATKEIPVVAMTSHAMIGDEEKALAAGFDGYLTKPINTREFPRQVAEFIAASHKEGEWRQN